MANPNQFKYNHVYRSPGGRLWIYKGSTCSSSRYGNSFNLMFEAVKPDPDCEHVRYVSFPMFNAAAECNGWTLDKAATTLYYKEPKLFYKNRE